MKIWSRIKLLSLKQLFRLSIAFIQKPLFIRPTLKATNETMIICNSLFGKSHHLSNSTNAFRHALWNILICQKTLKRTQNRDKSVIWAEKITNLYENITKNNILDKAMDLHNNKVGRFVFLSTFEIKTPEILILLQEMAQNALKINNIDQIENSAYNLVYIENI